MSEAFAAGLRTERLGSVALVQAAIGRLGRGGWPLVATFAATAAAAMVLRVIVTRLPPTSGLSLALAAVEVANMLVLSLGAACAARVFLKGGDGLRRIDRGLLECAGLLALADLIVYGASVAFASMSTAQHLAGAPAFLGLGLGYVALGFILLRLTLWPLGRLDGNARLTPRRAWRLMRRATRGFVLAHLLILLPVVLVGGVGAAAVGPLLRTLPYQLGGSVLGVGFVVISQAISVSVYVLRVSAPENLPDVFD